jgi:hypothetical protein
LEDGLEPGVIAVGVAADDVDDFAIVISGLAMITVRGAKLWVRRRRALRTPTTERIRWVKTSEPAPLRLDGSAP